MKKLLATGLVGACIGLTANGQGTVNFGNYFTGTASDPRIYFDNATLASGEQYRIGLYGGATAGNLTLLATTTFMFPGYFIDGVVPVPGVPGGSTTFLAVAAWDSTVNGTTTGATYEQAWTYGVLHGAGNMCGHSSIFSVVTGNPNATPPGLPADLVPGLTSFAIGNQAPLPTPEPSTFMLSALGAAVLLLFRRAGGFFGEPDGARSLDAKSNL